jgi:hypothetical protein
MAVSNTRRQGKALISHQLRSRRIIDRPSAAFCAAFLLAMLTCAQLLSMISRLG